MRAVPMCILRMDRTPACRACSRPAFTIGLSSIVVPGPAVDRRHLQARRPQICRVGETRVCPCSVHAFAPCLCPTFATGENSREQVDVLLLWLLAMRVRGAATGGGQLTTPYAAAGIESNCLTRFTNHQVTNKCLSALEANLLE